MSTADYTLPSITLVGRLTSDQVRTVATNISYPSRPNTHVPWAGPTTPLIISKTVSNRYDAPFVYASNSSNPVNPNNGFHVAFEVEVLRWIKDLLSHTRSIFLEKVDLLKERLATAHLPLALRSRSRAPRA